MFFPPFIIKRNNHFLPLLYIHLLLSFFPLLSLPLDSSPGALPKEEHMEGTEGWGKTCSLRDSLCSLVCICIPAHPQALRHGNQLPCPVLTSFHRQQQERKRALIDPGCLCSDDKKDYFLTQSCRFYWALNATTSTIHSPRVLLHRPLWPRTGLFKIY